MKRLTTKEFIDKAKVIHNNKYDYSKTIYKNSRTDVTIICPVHGEYQQNPASHTNNKRGCLKCSNNIPDMNIFIQKARDIHGLLYDYSKVNYINTHRKVTIICYKHGEYQQTPHEHTKGHGCPKCKSSKGELSIRKYLLEHKIKFEEQKTFPDCKDKKLLRFDFYLPEKNILIEFNGSQHYIFSKRFHRTQTGFQNLKKRDNIKERWASDNHIKLLIIPYTEMENISTVMDNNLIN